MRVIPTLFLHYSYTAFLHYSYIVPTFCSYTIPTLFLHYRWRSFDLLNLGFQPVRILLDHSDKVHLTIMDCFLLLHNHCFVIRQFFCQLRWLFQIPVCDGGVIIIARTSPAKIINSHLEVLGEIHRIFLMKAIQ